MSTDVFRRYIDIVTESAAHAVTEMDKSQSSHGRDGHLSHSTYGSRDKEGSDYFKGKELPAKPITVNKMEKDALDILKKQGMAEGSLQEFAPGSGGEPGRWYTDDEIADIIGEDWFEFDLSGEAANISIRGEHAKILLVQEAQTYFEDMGYHGVVVQDVRDDEDYLSWYISGNFTRADEGVAEGKKSDRYHIVGKDGKPVNLASYADRASAIKDRDEKYPGAVVQQVGPRGKVKGVAEGSLNEGQYEMMMRNGQVKKFIAKDDADAKRIAAGHGAKSVIRLKGGVPAGKVSEQGVAEGTKTLADYIAESERAYSQPVPGDYFAINIREETLFETWVCNETPDGIVIYADDAGLALLERYGYLGEAISEGHDFEIDSDEDSVDVVDQGEYDQEGDMAKDDLATIVRAARRLTGMLDDNDNLPEWVQAKITKAADYVDTAADYMESNREQDMAEGFGTDPTQPGTWHGHKIVANRKTPKGSFLIIQNKNDSKYEIHRQNPGAVGGLEFVSAHKTPEEMQTAFRQLTGVDESNQGMAEAKYQGREVPLGKPMKGDVKKSKVYVRGPKGNVVKVNFGQKGMKIKKNIPGRRKNFRARHNCANPGPRWKARYWSCRAW